MLKVNIGSTPNIMKGIFEIDNRSYNFWDDFLIKQHNVWSMN